MMADAPLGPAKIGIDAVPFAVKQVGIVQGKDGVEHEPGEDERDEREQNVRSEAPTSQALGHAE